MRLCNSLNKRGEMSRATEMRHHESRIHTSQPYANITTWYIDLFAILTTIGPPILFICVFYAAVAATSKLPLLTKLYRACSGARERPSRGNSAWTAPCARDAGGRATRQVPSQSCERFKPAARSVPSNTPHPMRHPSTRRSMTITLRSCGWLTTLSWMKVADLCLSLLTLRERVTQ